MRAFGLDMGAIAVALIGLSPSDRPTRLPGIQAFFGHYREQLAIHHRHEDELSFLALAARVGADRMQLTELTGQHERLDTALQGVNDSLADLADPTGDFATDRGKTASAL